MSIKGRQGGRQNCVTLTLNFFFVEILFCFSTLKTEKIQCSNFCRQFPFSILRSKSSKWKSPKVKMFFHVFLLNFITSATLTRLFLMTIKCKRYAWVGKSQNNLTISFYALQSSPSPLSFCEWKVLCSLLTKKGENCETFFWFEFLAHFLNWSLNCVLWLLCTFVCLRFPWKEILIYLNFGLFILWT